MKKSPIPSSGIPDFPENLFWDVDFKEIDWEKNKRWVMARVFNRGSWEDVKTLWRYYTEEDIRENIIKARWFDDRTLNFLSNYYNIPKQQFLCYTLKQSMPQLWF